MTAPRIAAYLTVKDESEIIEQSIAHLRTIGVDYIMVCDMSSSDGTAEILEGYRSDTFSILTLTDDAISDRTAHEDTWFGHSFRRYRNAPADWIIFLDADEFWLPASGSLKDCTLLDSVDILSVERYNIVLGPDGPLMPADLNPATYDQVTLIAERIPEFRLELQKSGQLPWIAGKVMPKIMARPSKISGLTAGYHDVIHDGAPLRRATPTDLVVAHLPFSTITRFERKLKNIRAIYEREQIDLSQPEETWQEYANAWHWRRWATISDSKAEFERNMLSLDRVAELRRKGTIRSARELLSLPGS